MSRFRTKKTPFNAMLGGTNPDLAAEIDAWLNSAPVADAEVVSATLPDDDDDDVVIHHHQGSG